MTCIFCNSKVKEVWNLGSLPPSDTFCNTKEISLKVQTEKLGVGVCCSCGLTQNTLLLSEKIRYEDIDYAYSSANSSYAKSHWHEFTNCLKNKNLFNNNSKILEVGANDGFLLNLIKTEFPKSEVVGLDASPFQVSNAMHNFPNLKMIQGIFGISKDELPNQFFDLVIGNNVLNHSNKLNNFLLRVKEVLIEGGYFIFEVPSLDMMFLKNKWDMIYHEHVSYFSIDSIMFILPQAGLSPISIELSEYHGGSFRVVAKKTAELNKNLKVIKNYEEEKLLIMKTNAEKQIANLIEKIKYIKTNSSRKIYFFGAPAKGATFINYSRLTGDLIDGCLETSENKIGKYIPKCGIPIIDENNVEKGSYAINLLWNIPNVFEEYCKKNNLEKINYEIN